MENKNKSVIDIVDIYTNNLLNKYPNKTPEEWTEYFNSLDIKITGGGALPFNELIELAKKKDLTNKDEGAE